MNLSGIVVLTSPEYVDCTIAALSTLPGVEVHYQDAATGRIVVTQEGESIDLEVQGLKRIKALPHVMLAEMVYHYFADDEERETFEGWQVPPLPPFLDD